MNRARSAAWALIAAIAALLSGAAAVLDYRFVAVLIACILTLTAMYRPKPAYLVSLAVVFFSSTLEQVSGSDVLGMLDEALALAWPVLAGALLVWHKRAPVALPGGLFFVLFASVGVLSGFIQQVPASVGASGALLALKGLLLGWAGAQLGWNRTDLGRLVRTALAAAIAIVAGCLMNLLIPAWWMNLLAPDVNLSSGSSLPVLIGPFTRPAALSRAAGLLCIVGIVYATYAVQRRQLAAWMAFLLAASAIATLRTKTILGLALAWMAIGSFERRIRGIVLLLVAVLTTAVLGSGMGAAIRSDFIAYTDESSARGLLYAGAYQVSSDFFPLGAGFGRYGSYVAASDYSPLYHSLGFSSRYGLADPDVGFGGFLTDTSWPAILGEAGWLGLVLFAAGLGRLAWWTFRLGRRLPEARPIAAVGLGWLALILAESTTAPVFTSAPSYPLVFALTGIAASMYGPAKDLPLGFRIHRRVSQQTEPIALRANAML